MPDVSVWKGGVATKERKQELRAQALHKRRAIAREELDALELSRRDEPPLHEGV